MAEYVAMALVGIEAVSSVMGGMAEEDLAKAEAGLLRRKASTRRAAAQREAIEERNNKELVKSRARAVAAAGGGGVDDPTIVNILGDIEGEGEFRALSRLWSGEEDATDLNNQAAARETSGKNAKKAGLIKGVSSVLQGYAGFADAAGVDAGRFSGATKGPGGSTVIPRNAYNDSVARTTIFSR